MGIIVPFSLCFLLRLNEPAQFFTIAVTCFVAWGVADLCASILIQPRLENRSPTGALRKWEEGKAESTADENSLPGSPDRDQKL